MILCNRINDTHSSVEILLDGKAVGNHGCDDSYCLHLNRTSVEALALSQLLDLQISLTDAKYWFSRLVVLDIIHLSIF